MYARINVSICALNSVKRKGNFKNRTRCFVHIVLRNISWLLSVKETGHGVSDGPAAMSDSLLHYRLHRLMNKLNISINKSRITRIN